MRAFATIFIGVGAAALMTAPLSAQSFNIDLAVGFGEPAATYGAAAAQPGTWNLKSTAPAAPLLNLDGSPSTVTCAATSLVSFSFNNAGTSGDEQALMDDIHDGANTYTIAGLAAGTYEVYTYAWAPDVPGDTSNVSVTGATTGANPTLTGTSASAPGGAFTTPGHYALHTITVAAGGTITIVVAADGLGFTSSNGIQIKLLGGGTPCPANIVNTGTSANRVDVDDLLAVIGGWGNCPAPPALCPANIVNTGTSVNRVDVDDLLAVIGQWGACPTK